MKRSNNETIENAHFESLYPDTSRFEEIEKILGYIKNGNSCQLIGLPGVGRSNLLGLLVYNTNVRIKHLSENQKWFHFVLCNFSEIRKKPLFEATKFIFLSLVDSLRERKMGKEYETLDKIFKESLVSNDELVLFQGLKRAIDFLSIEKELTVVFLFDRLEEYISMLETEFFANLRILRNRAKYRFSVVFSLNRPLEDLIEPTLFADFYEFLAGSIVYLPLLDKPGLDFWLSLTPSEQKLLVTNQLGTSGYLIDVGLIKDGKITIPLLEGFISIMKQSGSEAIQYDAVSNEIRKGDVILSDSLTSSEFKLLKFLLESPDKIIEREEIIKSVWSDAKSTEGVTDQALDQLIFRLRKKIEDDPNNPTHIQTLKGRGIRFVS